MTYLNACETHDEPGVCDLECLDLICLMMQGDGGGDYVPYDPTGCSYPKPMPTERPVLVEGTIRFVLDHPTDCQCTDEDCPEMLANA